MRMRHGAVVQGLNHMPPVFYSANNDLKQFTMSLTANVGKGSQTISANRKYQKWTIRLSNLDKSPDYKARTGIFNFHFSVF